MQEHNIGTNPYAAPSARVEQPVVDSPESRKSSRGARLGAYLVDLVIGVVCFAPYYVGIYRDYMRVAAGQAPSGSPDTFATIALVIGIALGIYTLVLLYRSGQTIGKKIVGIRIVRTDGSRAGLLRILGLRYVVPGLIGAIPFLGFFFVLADALVIFGEARRCIHDYIADTIVVDA